MLRDLITLSPAAGHSQRYVDEGILIPKPLIQFDHVVLGLNQCMVDHALENSPSPRYVACRDTQAAAFYGRVSGVVVPVGNTTRGQADTVFQALRRLDHRGPVLVVNSDQGFAVDLKAFCAEADDEKAEAAVLAFPSINPNYGYVGTYPDQVFNSGVEKPSGLSDEAWAVAGAFYFADAPRLCKALQRLLTEPGEPYLSQCYKHLDGTKVVIPMHEWQLYQWGTPADLRRDPYIRNLYLA